MALTDQQIRDLGILYLPLQQYLANPFQYNPNEETEETAALPVNLTGSNVGGGGGGGGASPFDLTPTFTTERRPAPTTDFNINPAAFLTGKGRTDPMGSDMDYFLNLPADRRFSFGFDIDSDFPGSPNYKPPSKFFEEPNLIDRGIGAFKNLFRSRKIRGTLGDRLSAQATGTFAGLPTISNVIGRFRNPLNPNATNYNPDLVGQLNYLEGQDGLIGRSSVGLKYGPESVLFGKNVISGFGTNDYEEALNKYIESAKLKLRRTTDVEKRKKIQDRINKGETELNTYLDKSGVQQERDDKRRDTIDKEKTRREKKGESTRAGAENTATGGFGGGKDIGGSTPGTSDQGFTDSGQFAGLKKGGLAGILYG
tara:strand:+ start:252 stop:1355 length:1104 start_codon:yes stop_codon:yes gene_type:complete